MFKKILGGAVIAVCAICLATLSSIEHNYKMNGTVINQTTIEDETGKLWEVDFIPFEAGTRVVISFNDNCSINTRLDDIVKKISLK